MTLTFASLVFRIEKNVMLFNLLEVMCNYGVPGKLREERYVHLLIFTLRV